MIFCVLCLPTFASCCYSAWGEGFFLAVQTAIVAALVLLYGTAPSKGKSLREKNEKYSLFIFHFIRENGENGQCGQCGRCRVVPHLFHGRRGASLESARSDPAAVDVPGVHRADHHRFKGEPICPNEPMSSNWPRLVYLPIV